MSNLHRALAWFALAVLLLMTFALRIYRLDAVDLRGDEAYSVVHWTVSPFSDAWMKLAKQEPHPAGAYTLFWAWDELVGNSVFANRMFSVLGNFLGTAVIITLARRYFRNWRLVLAVALLWMLNPLLIWNAQDARTYGVLSALTPLTFYWLLRALEDSEGSQKWRPWLPYIVLQAIAIYLYYFEIFWLTAQGLYVLSLRRKDLLKQAFKAWITIGLVCIPVGVQAHYLLFVNDYEGNASDANIRLLFEEFVPTLLFGDNTAPLLWGVLFTLAFIGGLLLVARRHQQAGLWLVWAILPPLLLYVVSNFSSFFRPRYVITVVPALILGIVAIAAQLPTLLASTGRFSLPANRPRIGVLTALTVTFLMATVSANEIYDYFYNDPPKAPDWVGLTDYLKARTTARDTVLSGQPDPAIEYYYPQTITFIPLEESNLDSAYAQLLTDYDAIYLLVGPRTDGAVAYFHANAQHIPGDSYPGVIQFRSWQVDPAEIQFPLDVQFGDIARLRGYSLLPEKKQHHAASTILLLYWEPLRQTEVEYSILVHFVTAVEKAGEPPFPAAAALDHGAMGSVVSTTQWTVGQLIRDPVTVPVDVPAGHYWIRIGLYEFGNTDNRVPLADAALESQFSGRYVIGDFTLR